MSTLHLPERRAADGLAAFQARPVIVAVAGRRHVLSPTDTQFVLRELARLPEARWPAAASATEIVSVGLSHGWPIAFDEDEERALLRAVEGVRARRKLSAGLRSLREALPSSGQR